MAKDSELTHCLGGDETINRHIVLKTSTSILHRNLIADMTLPIRSNFVGIR
jgi:hypothetical protein